MEVRLISSRIGSELIIGYELYFPSFHSLAVKVEDIKFMGYESLLALSLVQLQRRIATVAKDSSSVFISEHAQFRMIQRRITIIDVLDILRNGSISMPPEINMKKDTLECRMQRYVCGRNAAVVVALSNEDPSLLVVTVLQIRK